MKKMQVMGEIRGRSRRWLGWAALLLLVLVAVACEKEPGKGGLATITGKVWGRDINQNGFLHDSGYVGGVKVYISYGDNSWVDGSETTSPTGDYAFKGLQKGTYRLVVWAQCDSCLFNQDYSEQVVEITETRQVAVLPDFITYD